MDRGGGVLVIAHRSKGKGGEKREPRKGGLGEKKRVKA